MPVITFNEGDYLQTKVVEAGYYPTEITAIEVKKSSSGKSVNYWIDFAISDGNFKGKTRTVCFNTESNQPSLLGELQMYPSSYLLNVAIACGLDDGVKKENFQLDTDDLLHTPMDCKWQTATVEGRLINTIASFEKAGYAASAPAF